MNRYSSSFLLTTLIYTTLIVTIVFSNSNLTNIQKSLPKQDETLKVKIVTAQPQIVKKVEKKVVKKETPEKKIVKKEPIKKPKPKKIVKKKPTPKPQPKKIVKQEPKEIVKEIPKEVEPQPLIASKAIQQKPLPKVDAKKHLERINRAKQVYFSKVKQTINKNKTYPRIAVKRAIEGSVKVKFTLTQYGELVSFNILEGQRIFKKSIAKAIKKSFPITPPNNIFDENLDLFLTLNYKLY